MRWAALLVALSGCQLILGIPEGELDPPDETPDADVVKIPDAEEFDAGWRTVGGKIADDHVWEATDAGVWADGGAIPDGNLIDFEVDGGPIDAGLTPPPTGWQRESRDVDLSSQTLAVLLPRLGAPDGFVVRTATGAADGSFAIPDVPEGTYYFKWTPPGFSFPEIYVLEGSQPNLSFPRSGRPNKELATVVPTWMTFSVNGISPWSADDWFEVLIPALGAYWVFPFYGFFEPPTDGADSMRATAAWHSRGRALVRPGDLVYVAQLTPGTSSTGVVVKTLSRLMLTKDLFVKNGGTANLLQGRMSALTKNQTVAISFRRQQFGAYEDAMTPEGNVLEWVAGLVVDPMPGDASSTTFTHDLVIFQVPSGSDDVDMGAVIYADPYPTHWLRYYFGSVTVQRTYLAPGATTGALANATLTVNRQKTASVAEIVPVVSPARTPTLNGMDLMTDLTVPLAADQGPIEIAWTAPEKGSPNRFDLTIYQLRVDAGNTRFSAVVRFRTAGNRVLVPKDLLPVPGIYFAYLNAIDWDSQEPFEERIRFGPPVTSTAGLLTGTFTLVAPAKAGDAR
jgi:hypothetical protein